jgi:hypothetical protein
MLNSDFAMRMGSAFAERVRREAGEVSEAQLEHAFQVALGRAATADEQAACQLFLEKQEEMHAAVEPQNAGGKALSDFCRMMLATNEFVYVQ